MTKAEQLYKTKKYNPRKMSDTELADLKNFIFSKAGGKCQCSCGRDGVEYHHSKRGVNKDDRSIILICRECHSLIHNMEYKNIDKSTALMSKAKEKGTENWRRFNLWK